MVSVEALRAALPTTGPSSDAPAETPTSPDCSNNLLCKAESAVGETVYLTDYFVTVLPLLR